MKTNKNLCIVAALTGLIGTARAIDVAPGSTITLAQPVSVVASSQIAVTSQPVIVSRPVAQPAHEAVQAPQLLAYAPKPPAQGPQEFAGISDVPQEIAQTTQSTVGAVQGTSSVNDINHQGAIGVGPMIGEPMGIGAKFWVNSEMAIDGGAGWSFQDPDGFQIHADFLYHFFNLFHNTGNGDLPLYIGGGARVKFTDDSGQDNRAGIRFPFGAAYLCHNRPLEFYIECAPVLDVSPKVQLQWNGGIGIRYYFQ